MSVESTQENIKIEQRAIDALKKEIQEAVDRDETDRISNLEQQIQNHNDQIQRLQLQLQDEQSKEMEEAQEKAREEQKKKDKKFGLF